MPLLPDSPLTWISLGMSIWVVGLSMWIIFERRSPLATLSWILALSVLPVIGIAIYFLLGPRRFDRKKLRRSLSQEAIARARRAEDESDPDHTHAGYHLMRMCEAAGGPAARPRQAAVEIYTAGLDAYAAICEALETAQHHIHLEYYIWERDRIGARVRDVLVERARAGVEVRVIVDSFGSSKANRRFWRPLREVGGQVKRFNALSLRRLTRRLANFRTHRKIVVVDGRVGFTGGMNIVDYHSSEFCGDEAWRDTHMRLEGPAVRGLQTVFCEGWHYLAGDAPEGPAYYPELETSDDMETVQVVASGPDENRDAVHKLFFSSIAGAGHRVLLSSAYFVPDDVTFSALAAAALRGADVRVLVPAKNDVRMVSAASRSFYPELLDIGIRIFEYGPPMLHSKTLVVDDRVAVVGTANTDRRSFQLNFEVVVASYDRDTADLLANIFDDDLAKSVEVTTETVAAYSFRARLFQNFARLMSPLL